MINKTMGLLGFLGLAAGLGLETPGIAPQTTMKQSDLYVGVAITGFRDTLVKTL